MKITCQSCQSKYTVSDDKVQGKTVKIKCRKCGATILVNSSGATTTNAGSAEAAAATETAAADAGSYMVNVAEGDQRTMSLQEIVQAYNTSVVTADTYVWADGMGDWQPLGQVPAIVEALNAASGGGASAAAAPVQAPAPEPAPRAAAVKKDAGRTGRDLFGTGGEPRSDIATSAPLFSANSSGGGGAPAPARNVPTGGREENSVLFSLSALTARTGAAPGPSPSASPLGPSKTSNSEDSGLIDLKALAAGSAAPPAASAAASLLGDSGGLFQLAAPPVTAAAPPTTAPVDEAPAKKNRTGLFIALGGVVAAVAIVGAFMAMKGTEQPPPEPTPTVAATNTPPALDTAPPPPPPTADTADTAAPTASAATTKAGGTTTKAGGGGTTTKAGGGGGTTTKAGGGGGTATPPPTTTAKPRGNCGCAAGDLMCAMRCSAKGK
ncbi:zinc-ribbon domain-containing protein [Polyangium aurulentum]|uniref:zinc-ribbon domain-containing protein n=1 Tax=Polyangium aurulentum TaxID=2567896 RepID=UPI0010AE5F72|nr:zinc-ribbon domain-containing protein [Polyangium aurulentum]UQA63992.1 zinc-ribbon domain-containing protein [Polyangium aurulentum]